MVTNNLMRFAGRRVTRWCFAVAGKTVNWFVTAINHPVSLQSDCLMTTDSGQKMASIDTKSVLVVLRREEIDKN